MANKAKVGRMAHVKEKRVWVKDRNGGKLCRQSKVLSKSERKVSIQRQLDAFAIIPMARLIAKKSDEFAPNRVCKHSIFHSLTESLLQLFAFVWQALDVFGRPQRTGTGADGMHDYPDEGSGGRNRGVKGPRPHGVGGGDEQHSQSG